MRYRFGKINKIIKQVLLYSVKVFLCCVAILTMLVIIDWNDLYPSHIYYRHKLRNFIKSGQQEIYLRDLVSFKFKEVHIIGSYDNPSYNTRCKLQYMGTQDDPLWAIAYVTEACEEFIVLLNKAEFPNGRDKEFLLGYDEAKLKLRYNEPNVELQSCFGHKEPCLIMER